MLERLELFFQFGDNSVDTNCNPTNGLVAKVSRNDVRTLTRGGDGAPGLVRPARDAAAASKLLAFRAAHPHRLTHVKPAALRPGVLPSRRRRAHCGCGGVGEGEKHTSSFPFVVAMSPSHGARAACFLTLASWEGGGPVAPHTHDQGFSHQAVAFVAGELQRASSDQVVFLNLAVRHLPGAFAAPSG